jgi:hypothetical protein
LDNIDDPGITDCLQYLERITNAKTKSFFLRGGICRGQKKMKKINHKGRRNSSSLLSDSFLRLK